MEFTPPTETISITLSKMKAGELGTIWNRWERSVVKEIAENGGRKLRSGRSCEDITKILAGDARLAEMQGRNS